MAVVVSGDIVIALEILIQVVLLFEEWRLALRRADRRVCFYCW